MLGILLSETIEVAYTLIKYTYAGGMGITGIMEKKMKKRNKSEN